jgi:hypothetical protein
MVAMVRSRQLTPLAGGTCALNSPTSPVFIPYFPLRRNSMRVSTKPTRGFFWHRPPPAWYIMEVPQTTQTNPGGRACRAPNGTNANPGGRNPASSESQMKVCAPLKSREKKRGSIKQYRESEPVPFSVSILVIGK